MKYFLSFLGLLVGFAFYAQKAPEFQRKVRSFEQASNTKERCSCLLHWSDQLFEEYPQLSKSKTPINQLTKKIVPLFTEQVFEPVFGKPYTALSEKERKSLHKASQKCKQQKEFAEAFIWFDYVMAPSFQDDPRTIHYQLVLDQLPPFQSAFDAFDRVYSEVDNYPETEDGFIRLQSVVRASGLDWRSLWPSQKVLLEDKVQGKKQQIAAIILAQKAQLSQTENDAFQATYNWQFFEEQNSDYLKALPEETQKEYETLATKSLAEASEALLQEEEALLANLPTGPAFIEDWNTFHLNLQQRYRILRNTSIQQRVTAASLDARNKMLLDETNGIKAQFAKSPTIETTRNLEAVFTAIPLDQSQAYSDIHRLAEEHIAFLKSEMKKDPNKAWLLERVDAQHISSSELLNILSTVSLDAGIYTEELEKALLRVGKKVAPNASLVLELKVKLNPLTYTRHVNGSLTNETPLMGSVFELSLKQNGAVYRGNFLFPAELVLAHGFSVHMDQSGTGIIDPSKIQQILNALVSSLFENHNAYSLEGYGNNEWEEAFEASLSVADNFKAVYERAEESIAFTQLMGIDKISAVQARHDQTNPVYGFEATKALTQMEHFDLFDQLFYRGTVKASSSWNPEKKWRRSLEYIPIEVYNGAEKDRLPVVEQVVSGSSLQITGDNTPDGFAVVSKSTLKEPNCVVEVAGKMYRTAAMSMVFLEVVYTAENLAPTMNVLTDAAVSHFIQKLGLTNTDRNTEYATKPESYTFNISSIHHTDIRIEEGDRVELHASGTVNFGTFAGSGGPDGIGGFEMYNRVAGERHGALLVQIGNGEWRPVGTQNTIKLHQGGQLSLMVNDKEPQNNRGSYQVTVNVFKRL